MDRNLVSTVMLLAIAVIAYFYGVGILLDLFTR
jgi:hypothetical protein